MHLPVEALFKLTVYSHFFKINLPKTRIIQLALKFCYKYITSGFVKDRNKPIEMKVLKVFAARTRDNNEFRFHIGQLPEFMKMLDYNFITSDMYDVEIVDMYHAEKFNFKLKPHFVLRDYQEDVVDFIVTNDSDDNHSRLVCLPTGTGKAQPLDAAIKIPNGWSTMGNMIVGSKVIARDGSIANVIGTYPQGIKNIFKITFEDERSTECTLDHLWKVYIGSNNNVGKVISIKEIITLLSNDNYKDICYIDLNDSENGIDLILPEKPYFIGSNIDTLFGNSSNRDIPEFINCSHNQRLDIIQGIFDSKGRVVGDGSIEVYTPYHDSAKVITEIARSLGCIVNTTLVNAEDYYLSIYDESYTLKDYYLNSTVTELPPKKGYLLTLKHKNIVTLFSDSEIIEYSDFIDFPNLKLKISNIEYVGTKEAMCIAIDHKDHLYITNDYIVTHNTLASLASITEINTRTVVLVLPSFMDKWAGDVTNTIDVKPKEIMLVRGSDQLKGVIDLAVDNTLTSKFIIISLTTIQNFFKAYEENNGHIEDLGYGCAPEDLYKILKVGTIIIDETHLHIHAVFKTMLYTHVNKIIALSATLISDDPMISRIHRVMFPKEIRFDKVQMKKYIKVRAISHRFYDYQNAKIRTTQYGSNVYSHGEFEKSIIKNRSVFNNYLKLIDSLIESGYIQDYIKGDKLAIFAASVNMCTRIVDHIKMKYPQFDTRRYVEEDPYKNIIEADIRVTTILSGGTAIDIPKLRVVIMLVNVQSPVSNLQTLGRLRELPDRDVKFYYVYSEQIPKQVEYHRRKMDLFADRSLSIKDIRSNIML